MPHRWPCRPQMCAHGLFMLRAVPFHTCVVQRGLQQMSKLRRGQVFQPGVLLLGKKRAGRGCPHEACCSVSPDSSIPRLVATLLQCVSAERWKGSMWSHQTQDSTWSRHRVPCSLCGMTLTEVAYGSLRLNSTRLDSTRSLRARGHWHHGAQLTGAPEPFC